MSRSIQSSNTAEKIKNQMKIKEAQSKFSRCREAFKILIGEREHQIWDIEDYEHDYGKLNNETPTYWLETEDGTLEPYIRTGSHRICWEINYKQTNSAKHKWGSTDLRGNGTCIIKANGKPVYSFGSSSLEYALSKAQSLVVELREHCYNFINPEEEKGRKIWYYNLPATIQPSDYHPGEIRICPDYVGEFEGRKNHWKWWDEYHKRSRYGESEEDEEFDKEHLAEYRGSGSINHGNALFDGNIRWFRKEKEKESKSQPLAEQ